MAMTLRLDSHQDRALSLLADAWGCSKQEAAVRAIVVSAQRTLADAETIIPEQAVLAARIRRNRG